MIVEVREMGKTGMNFYGPEQPAASASVTTEYSRTGARHITAESRYLQSQINGLFIKNKTSGSIFSTFRLVFSFPHRAKVQPCYLPSETTIPNPYARVLLNEGKSREERNVQFSHVLKHHVHVVIKAQQRSNELLIGLHNHVDTRANALVNQLQWSERRSRHCLRWDVQKRASEKRLVHPCFRCFAFSLFIAFLHLGAYDVLLASVRRREVNEEKKRSKRMSDRKLKDSFGDALSREKQSAKPLTQHTCPRTAYRRTSGERRKSEGKAERIKEGKGASAVYIPGCYTRTTMRRTLHMPFFLLPFVSPLSLSSSALARSFFFSHTPL